jgi:hypothetical protein
MNVDMKFANVAESVKRWGYAHTSAGILSDTEIAATGLLAVRGVCVDTFFPDTSEGRAAWDASQKPRK